MERGCLSCFNHPLGQGESPLPVSDSPESPTGIPARPPCQKLRKELFFFSSLKRPGGLLRKHGLYAGASPASSTRAAVGASSVPPRRVLTVASRHIRDYKTQRGCPPGATRSDGKRASPRHAIPVHCCAAAPTSWSRWPSTPVTEGSPGLPRDAQSCAVSTFRSFQGQTGKDLMNLVQPQVADPPLSRRRYEVAPEVSFQPKLPHGQLRWDTALLLPTSLPAGSVLAVGTRLPSCTAAAPHCSKPQLTAQSPHLLTPTLQETAWHYSSPGEGHTDVHSPVQM